MHSIDIENEMLKSIKSSNIEKITRLLEIVNPSYILRIALSVFDISNKSRKDIITFLINSGADINWKDENGKYTGEYIAEVSEEYFGLAHFDELEYFINLGLNANEIWNNGQSLLIMMAMNGNMNGLKFLERMGVNNHFTEALEYLINRKDISDDEFDFDMPFLKYLILKKADIQRENFKSFKIAKKKELFSVANVLAYNIVKQMNFTKEYKEAISWVKKEKYFNTIDLITFYGNDFTVLLNEYTSYKQNKKSKKRGV